MKVFSCLLILYLCLSCTNQKRSAKYGHKDYTGHKFEYELKEIQRIQEELIACYNKQNLTCGNACVLLVMILDATKGPESMNAIIHSEKLRESGVLEKYQLADSSYYGSKYESYCFDEMHKLLLDLETDVYTLGLN